MKLSDKARRILVDDLGDLVDEYHRMRNIEGLLKNGAVEVYKEAAEYLSDIRKEIQRGKK